MLVRLERPPKRELAVHKRRLGVSDAEIRQRAELGDALLLFFLMDAEGDLDDGEDDDCMLFLVACDFDRLFTWVDSPVDALVARLLEIDTMSPQLLREVTRFEQAQLRELHDLLGVPPAMRLDNRCVASGESLLIVYLKLLARWNTLTDLERNFVGRHYSIISRMRKVFGQWLYDTHAWRVKDNLAKWTPHFYDWNQAIRNKHVSEFGEDVPLRCKNVCAGIDCKFYHFTEPGSKELAAAMYNGYEGCCGMKIESITGPGGQAFGSATYFLALTTTSSFFSRAKSTSSCATRKGPWQCSSTSPTPSCTTPTQTRAISTLRALLPHTRHHSTRYSLSGRSTKTRG